MRWTLILWVLMPALAFGANAVNQARPDSGKTPSFGLSNNVIGYKNANDHDDSVTRNTQRLLNQQAHSGGAKHSEISAPVYVETQKRLSKSFTRPIKSFAKNQTTQGNLQ